jgi:hypothetical protein
MIVTVVIGAFRRGRLAGLPPAGLGRLAVEDDVGHGVADGALGLGCELGHRRAREVEELVDRVDREGMIWKVMVSIWLMFGQFN